jgi:hypothetical protein
MKTHMIVLLTLLSFSLQAEAKRSVPAPKAEPEPSTPVSAQAIRDLSTLTDPNATFEDFKGTWVKTLHGEIVTDEYLNIGFMNAAGIKNADLSQHTLTIEHIDNDWLPSGQSLEPRITESNLLGAGVIVQRRPEVVGNKIEYSREAYAIAYVKTGYHDTNHYENYVYARDYKDITWLLPQITSGPKRRPVIATGPLKVVRLKDNNNNSTEYNQLISCFILNGNKNRLICHLQASKEYYGMKELLYSTVLGFERLTPESSVAIE